MDGAKLIERIRLKNILSFGEEGQEIALEPLNVLIGPNGSGKSNLLESVGLLHAAPSDFTSPFRNGGTASEWAWKGTGASRIPQSEIQIGFENVLSSELSLLLYRIRFAIFGNRVNIVEEMLEDLQSVQERAEGTTYLHRQNLHASLFAHDPLIGKRKLIERDLSDVLGSNSEQSVLAQLRDRYQYPELTYLSDSLKGIKIYRGFDTGRSVPARLPQLADLPDHYLLEDASNLGLVLNLLEVRGKKRRILELLQKFYDPTEDFTIRVQGGTVQFYLHERGLTQPISAMRLSDGTLHFLYLLAILLHPAPPPLICIEEPEIGLHPDVIPTVAELLVEASQRTQLIVTTHSDALVSALSATPEAIVVCERDERGTQLRRLEPDRLKEWLERYTLGDLWHMGEIGGTRW